MVSSDSSLDSAELKRARILLTPPKQRDRLWPALGAAALLALTALAFAAVMILAPPVVTEHVAEKAPG